jgi:hypothetical protein
VASQPDAAAQGALGADVRRPVRFVWLDVAGDPLRVTDAPYSIQFTGTGDPDLDGHTFDAFGSQLLSVSPVRVREDGTDTVTLTLSGLAGIDDELMTLIGDKSKFQGRDCRIWYAMLDPENFGRIGTVWCDYTGYMTLPRIAGDKESQVIQLEVETYLAFLKRASGRTYLDQARYDPGDQSARLAIAIANGARDGVGGAIPKASAADVIRGILS